MLNSCVLTFDTEWAPDYVLDIISEELIAKNIKATWFITHDSPAIRRIIKHSDLFEIGIHPNFLANSTQGKNETEILAYLKKIVPKATIVRTHALVQSSRIFYMMVKQFGITTDVSLLLPYAPNLVPHTIYYDHRGTALIRVPYFWEDDVEMYEPRKSWNWSDAKYQTKGLRIFDFHPVHIYLNLDSMDAMYELKKYGALPEVPKKILDAYKNKHTKGVHTLFYDLLDSLKREQQSTYTISEIVKLWENNV